MGISAWVFINFANENKIRGVWVTQSVKQWLPLAQVRIWESHDWLPAQQGVGFFLFLSPLTPLILSLSN